MRFSIVLILMTLCLTGCSLFSSGSGSAGGKRDQLSKSEQVTVYLESGRDKAALAAANELVAESPDDYLTYLTRNTVHLVMRNYAAAQADNEKALEVYTAARQRYPEKERDYRMAKIHESFALTALLASRRSQDPKERKRLEADYARHADTVRQLDEETWKNLRGLAGEKVGE